MVDLFISRLEVKVADRARRLGDFASAHLNTEEVQRTQLAAMHFTDVSDETLELLEKSSAGSLLSAFWTHYQIALPEAASRVLVNPPPGLNVSGHVMTLTFQKWLTGTYGRALTSMPTPLDFVDFESAYHGYFEDAVIFWDVGLDVSALASCLLPGATVTVIRPRPAKHGFWMAWTGLDLSFKTVTDGLSQRFKLRNLTSGQAENFESTTFGLEGK